MPKSLRFIAFCLFYFLVIPDIFSQSQVFNSSGTFTVPAGVTSVKVEAWGGGAGGNNNTNRGGGGGAFAGNNSIPVTAGTNFSVTVGGGGTNGGNGGASIFGANLVVAAGAGTGGNNWTGGSVGASIGAAGLVFKGGDGGSSSGNGGAGGGGSAGAGGAGGNAGSTSNNTGGTAGGAGLAGAGSPGASGGAGGNSTSNGANGGTPGGGGGERGASGGSSGAGAPGRVIVSYTQFTYKSQLVSMSLGSSTWCTGETRNVTIQIKNIGTATWTDGTGGTPDINIGVKWNTNGANWTDYHVRVNAGNLAPGATGVYILPITAANNAGSGYTSNLATGINNLTFDVVYEGLSWFGDNGGGVGPGNTRFVSANQTIAASPTANAGGAMAAICQGGTSTGLGGSVGGSANGGSWSDGGIGGTFSPNASTLNATWKPPVSFSGTATLTLTTTGGSCGAATASKNITVNATPTVSIGAALPTICQGGTSSPLGGAVGGSATGGTWTSSAGGTFTPNANTLNATWTPPATFSGNATLTLTTTGGSPCASANASKIQSVTANATVDAGANLPAFCQGGVSAGLSGLIGGSATGGLWSDGGIGGTFSPNASTLNATWRPPVSYNGTATLTLTATGGCGAPTDTKSQVVNAAPASIQATPGSSTICLGSTATLSGFATLSGTSASVIENFNSTTPFTVSGSSSGNRSQVWQQESSGTNVNVATFTSPGGGNLMVATAGASGLFDPSSVSSILTSGIINTASFSSLTTLTFSHTYKDGSNSGTGIVEVSTNGGTTWTSVATYNSNQGSSTGFVTASIPFAAYSNQSNLKIRFNFTSTNQNFIVNNSSWWAVDDITLNGVRVPLYSWTANTAAGVNGLPPGAGTPSLSNASIVVNPTATTSYTFNATNPSTNCMGSTTPIVVNVNPAPSFSSIADVALTTSADGTGNCTANYNWTHPGVNTTCPTTLKVEYTAGPQAPAMLPTGGIVTSGGSASALFSTGTTIVTYTATDQNDNTAVTSFKVTVTDDENPAITCEADIQANNTTGQCYATIALSPPSATDNCGVASITNDHPSNQYPVGTTDVIWTVVDESDNRSTCLQKVIVVDTELPAITCNGAITVSSDPGLCSAIVNLSAPTTSDNCGVAGVVSDHPSNVFPVGTTIVKWTVTDNAGHTSSCDQPVTVTDNEKPAIICPASITTVTDPGIATGSVVLVAPVVTDNCGVQTTVNNHPSTAFPIGTTIVTWTSTDVNGNVSTCLQTVVVNDPEEPAMNCSAPITFNNDPGNCDGTTDITYPAATDNSGHVTVTADYAGLPTPSVDPVTPLVVNSVNFPVGLTTIIWTAVDPSMNTTWCTQMVSVLDNEKPSISCPAEINKTSDAGLCSAVIDLGTPVTNDNCGVASVSKDHPSDVYPVGVTMVTWTVTDIHGNVNSCTQKVKVTDNELPDIVCAADVNINNDNGECYGSVTLTPPTTGDNCGVASLTNNHTSNIFPVGTTVVTWKVTDIHGNEKTCTQKVTVTDNELPVITANNNISVNSDPGQCEATVVIIPATAADNCGFGMVAGTRDDALGLTAPYPVGVTTITWNVIDIHGNAAVPVQQTVTVTDQELPVIHAGTAISQTADAGQCGALVSIPAATATDNCGVGAPVGTRSDALPLDVPYPVGTTVITWTVKDIHGNSAIAVTQSINITDNELPVITPSADITQTADAGECGAAIVVSVATATDNCSVGEPHGTRSDGQSLNAPFPVGTTTITWNVTDIHGNAGLPVNQTVTVTDDERPVITASADISVVNDHGNCSAVVAIDPATATDNCGVGAATGTRSDGLSLGTPYPVGVTTITWTVKDIHNNAAVDVVQTITVADNEAPIITAAADISKASDPGQCSATISISPATATDNCGVGAPAGIRSDGLLLTDPYPVGTTTVTWNVSDMKGNAALPVLQYINVNDNELPVITSSPAILQTADAGQCGASVTIVPATATDNCEAKIVAGTRSDGLPLTEPYPVGTTTITWKVDDIHGNAALHVNQLVTVTDNETPTIIPAPDVFVSNDPGLCSGTVVLTTPQTGDNCAVQNVTNDHPSSTYPVGITTVTWTVTDIHGNLNSSTQMVTVTDAEKPTFTKPADKTIYANASCSYDAGIAVTGDVQDEHDNCSSGIQATYTDAVADGPCVGSKVISRTWHLVDNVGNAAADQVQTITVKDNIAPVIVTCAPSVTVVPNYINCTSTLLDYRTAVVATDCNGVTLSQLPLPGTALPLGANTITITATDACGNSSSCSFTVTVNKTLDLIITNSNPQLYYGYSLDQSTIITAKPTGGVAPYKVVVTMSRALGCNAVTSTGDESWAGASGGSSISNTCPAAGAGSIPVTTASNISAGGSYAVTATLMANATISVTVTDANGCTATRTTFVASEDARCFAGNSTIAKVKICHQTGNSIEKCHEICVAESAVKAHLDHGDFLGSCTPTCVAPPPPVTRAVIAPVYSPTLEVNVMPNPSPTFFNVVIKGRDANPITVRVLDVHGRVIQLKEHFGAFSTLRLGDRWTSGTYLIEVFQGTERKVVKVIKAK